MDTEVGVVLELPPASYAAQERQQQYGAQDERDRNLSEAPSSEAERADTARKIYRALHIALLSRAAVRVKLLRDAPAQPLLEAGSPPMSPTRTPFNARQYAARSTLQFSSLLSPTKEDAVEPPTPEQQSNDALQYVQSLVALSTDATCIATLPCTGETTVRDIYNAFAAALLLTPDFTDTPVAGGNVAGAGAGAGQGNGITAGDESHLSDEEGKGVSTSLTHTDAAGGNNSSGTSQAGVKRLHSLGALRFPTMSAIADVVAKSVATVARFGVGLAHSVTESGTPASGGAQGRNDSGLASSQAPQRTEETHAQAPRSGVDDPPPGRLQVRAVVLHQVDQASPLVQQVLGDILEFKRIPLAALTQYQAEREAAALAADTGAGSHPGTHTVSRVPSIEVERERHHRERGSQAAPPVAWWSALSTACEPPLAAEPPTPLMLTCSKLNRNTAVAPETLKWNVRSLAAVLDAHAHSTADGNLTLTASTDPRAAGASGMFPQPTSPSESAQSSSGVFLPPQLSGVTILSGGKLTPRGMRTGGSAPWRHYTGSSMGTSQYTGAAMTPPSAGGRDGGLNNLRGSHVYYPGGSGSDASGMRPPSYTTQTRGSRRYNNIRSAPQSYFDAVDEDGTPASSVSSVHFGGMQPVVGLDACRLLHSGLLPLSTGVEGSPCVWEPFNHDPCATSSGVSLLDVSVPTADATVEFRLERTASAGFLALPLGLVVVLSATAATAPNFSKLQETALDEHVIALGHSAGIDEVPLRRAIGAVEEDDGPFSNVAPLDAGLLRACMLHVSLPYRVACDDIAAAMRACEPLTSMGSLGMFVAGGAKRPLPPTAAASGVGTATLARGGEGATAAPVPGASVGVGVGGGSGIGVIVPPPRGPHARALTGASYASGASELFSPRKAQEISVALARIERTRWMRPLGTAELKTLLNEECGTSSISMSPVVQTAINELLVALRVMPCEATLGDWDKAQALTICRDISPWLMDLDPSCLPDDPLQLLAQYRRLLSNLVEKVSPHSMPPQCWLIRDDAFACHLTAAVRAQAALEKRSYATIDDVHAVVWACVGCP